MKLFRTVPPDVIKESLLLWHKWCKVVNCQT